MDIFLTSNETIIKVFNNNIVLINSEGIEKILISKGIGFGKRHGSIISKGTKIENVFVIEDKSKCSR